MKKISALFLVALMPVLCLQAKKVAVFQDSFKTPSLTLDQENICVVDQYLSKIFIYSRVDFQKLKEFGRKGSGPGEFISINAVTLSDDLIYASCFPKLCVFSKNGTLKKEIKSSSNAGHFLPLGKNFIGQTYPFTKHTDTKGKIQFSLFNPGLSKVKDIYTAEFNKFIRYARPKQIVLLLRDCNKAAVYADKLFIGSTDRGMHFSIFDPGGNLLYEINLKYEKRQVTEKEKKQYIDNLKKVLSPAEWNKRNAIYEYTFPEYYPAYENFALEKGRIYVFLYPKDGKRDILTLNLKGKVLKKKTIEEPNYPGCIEFGRFDVHDGKLYYMEENGDTENWELHEVEIN